MSLSLKVVLISIGMFLVGCGEVISPKKYKDIRPDQETGRNYDLPLEFYPASETGLSYATEETSSEAWIYLVAGSIRGANFAQEVIEQKNMWLERGAKESEIACYYVIPDKINFDSDAAQYRSLAAALSKCKIANFGAITEDLKRSAQNAKELYFYVTSHGDRPLSYYAQKADSEDKRARLNAVIDTYPVLDRYVISTDANKTQAAEFIDLLKEIDAGALADDLFLTPFSLNNALSSFAPEAKKTVVIQGCYSGGFVSESDPKFQKDLLSNTPNVTVLTAARNDRPSFGCGTGDAKTFFGGAILDVLQVQDKALPNALDWLKVFDATKAKVEELETKENYKPSEPQFFSNK